MFTVTESKSQGELGIEGKIDFTGKGDMAVGGRGEGPIHVEVPMEVGPAIGLPYEPTGNTRKRNAERKRQPAAFLPRHKNRLAVRSCDVAVVAIAAYFKMGCE